MNYLVKARARLDLTRHWKYIARDNLDAADQMLLAAKVTFALIADNPDLGSQHSFRKLVGIRSRSVAGFRNYLVFYQRRGDAVVILRVLHGMMDLPRCFVRRRA